MDSVGQELRRAQHAQLVHVAQFLGPQQMRLKGWGHDRWRLGSAEACFLTMYGARAGGTRRPRSPTSLPTRGLSMWLDSPAAWWLRVDLLHGGLGL